MKKFLTIILLCSATAIAHPVTFEGGSMPMFEFGGDTYAAHYSYSLTNKAALAGHYLTTQTRDTERRHYAGASINTLLKRWNMPAAQANIYTWIGPAFTSSEGKSDSGGVVGYQVDWETRRLYTASEGNFYLMGGAPDYTKVKLRAGVAPYIAPFDGFHTFLIAEATYKGLQGEEDWDYGPVARFFYDAYLLEIGVNQDGMPMGTVMAQIYF